MWIPELADTWAQAYGLVAKVMVAAAEQHEDIAPAYWEADVVSVERRLVEVAVIEIAPRQEFPYRAGQSVAVEILHRPRLRCYFSPATLPSRRGACSSTSSQSLADSSLQRRFGGAVGFPSASIRREQFDFLQGAESDDTVESR